MTNRGPPLFVQTATCRSLEGSGEPSGITLNHLDVATGKGAIASLSRDRRTLTGVKVWRTLLTHFYTVQCDVCLPEREISTYCY